MGLLEGLKGRRNTQERLAAAVLALVSQMVHYLDVARVVTVGDHREGQEGPTTGRELHLPFP